MKAETYNKQLGTNYREAFDWMTMKNQASRRANNYRDIYCVVPGHNGNNYAVVDLRTAIDLGLGYVTSDNCMLIENPWKA